MKCPICGSKMYQSICPYCKITSSDVVNASNRMAKYNILHGNKDKVVYSTVIPKDINKIALILFCLLGGIVGLDSFYIGRYVKGVLSFIPYFIAFGFSALKQQWPLNNFIGLCSYVAYFWCAIVVIVYFINVFALIFKSYKIPVTLPPYDENLIKNKKNWKNNL